jgi:hypothetical protein
MGLLDDAIREHLELKKRHGADPTEIADLERDAFGPARRAPEPLEVPADGEVASELSEAVGEPAEVVPPEVVPPEEPVASAAVPEAPADLEPDPVAEDLAWEDAAVEAAPPGPPAEPAAEGEDVLEETPEFLQETPEHDRLWFEQRPPRDFDFDG